LSGCGTKIPKAGFIFFGTVFLVAVILLTNVASLVKSRQMPSYATTVCQTGFKECISFGHDFILCTDLLHDCKSSRVFNQAEPIETLDQKPKPETILKFTEEENMINLRRCKKQKFHDVKFCKYLCDQISFNQDENRICEEICFTLSRSENKAGEICPYQKYCREGCPCAHFECKKTAPERQMFSPVWDLSSSEKMEVDRSQLIYKRQGCAKCSETLGSWLVGWILPLPNLKPLEVG
jgi:hypothetical protein